MSDNPCIHFTLTLTTAQYEQCNFLKTHCFALTAPSVAKAATSIIIHTQLLVAWYSETTIISSGVCFNWALFPSTKGGYNPLDYR